MANYKDKQRRKRIVELEVDERSLVDKPAIGEGFYLFKRMEGEPTMDINKVVSKAADWGQELKKSESEGTCQFCKKEGGREPKIGLRCSVCFACAVERTEKGVFDQCLEGSFDFEKYKAANPDEFTQKADDQEEDSSAEKPKPEDKEESPSKESSENGEKPKGDESQEDSKDSESKPKDSEESEKENSDSESKPNEKSKPHDLASLTKQVGELQELLEQSLSLHDNAAQALNQIVVMLMTALEQVSILAGGQGEQGESTEAVAAASEFNELSDKLKSMKGEMLEERRVSKVGAKISSTRLRTLEEIASKLTDLIQALGGGKRGRKKSETIKSVETLVSERMEGLQATLLELRNQSNDKLDRLIKRVDNLENTAGASGAIEDDDDREPMKKESDQSIFAPLLGLDEIRVQKQRRDAFLNGEQDASESGKRQ